MLGCLSPCFPQLLYIAAVREQHPPRYLPAVPGLAPWVANATFPNTTALRPFTNYTGDLEVIVGLIGFDSTGACVSGGGGGTNIVAISITIFTSVLRTSGFLGRGGG